MKSAREGPCSLFLNVSKFILFLALFYPFSLSAADINPLLTGCFQSDTHFKTDPAEWNPAAGLQKKGFYITASNYPPPSIWIDFVLSPDKQKIVRVVHGKGMNF